MMRRRYFSTLDVVINPRKQKVKPRTPRKMTPRFVDTTRIKVQGGMGGQGSLSSILLQGYKKVPDGGHGGSGGAVIIVADPQAQSLQMSKKHYAGGDGTHGSSQGKHGRTGENTLIRVPCGVVVKRVLEKQVLPVVDDDQDPDGDDGEELDRLVEMLKQGKEIEVHPESEADTELDRHRRELEEIVDLDSPGSYVMVAKGGRGGFGSSLYASHHGPMPDVKTMIQNAKPEVGEIFHLELELKMIADVGLVGFPNAGKSSLLRALSRATPEVAPYPFTTLNPIIGTVEYRDGRKIRVADLPGLVDGASQGRGRGHDFLRHIERTRALLYIVDAAGVDYRDPVQDLEILVRELETYGDGSLLDRQALVVANKTDLLQEERVLELKEVLEQRARDLGIKSDHHVMGISAGVTGDGLGNLAQHIRSTVLGGVSLET